MCAIPPAEIFTLEKSVIVAGLGGGASGVAITQIAKSVGAIAKYGDIGSIAVGAVIVVLADHFGKDQKEMAGLLVDFVEGLGAGMVAGGALGMAGL